MDCPFFTSIRALLEPHMCFICEDDRRYTYPRTFYPSDQRYASLMIHSSGRSHRQRAFWGGIFFWLLFLAAFLVLLLWLGGLSSDLHLN